ncbi:translocation/assembly module TamB [bacterium]|nr:translocation/assembly module TamB [bacterium]MBU1994914.1 translocation/assembly module TamB [bacterium]
MIKKVYLFFRCTTILTIAMLSIMVFLFTHKEVVPYLAQKYLKEFGVEYTKIEGTFFGGITVNDLKYKEAIRIKTLQIKYSFLMLIKPTPKVSLIMADGVYVDVNKLPSSDDKATKFSLLSFSISQLKLKDTKIVLEDETFAFDLNSTNIHHYHGNLDIKKLAIRLKTSSKEDMNAPSRPSIIQANVQVSEFAAKNIFAENANVFASYFASKITLKNTKVLFDNEVYTFDSESYNIYHQKGDVDIKKLALNLKSFSLETVSDVNIASKPRILQLNTEIVHLGLKNILGRDENLSASYAASKLSLKNAKIMLAKDVYSFDSNASDIVYNKALDVKKLTLKLAASPYGKGVLDGEVSSSRLRAKSFLDLDDFIYTEYLPFIKGIPQTLKVDLDVTTQKVWMHTNLEKITLSADENLSVENADVNLSYFIEDAYFKAKTNYRLSYNAYALLAQQDVLFTLSGAYASTFNATLTKHPMPLPFKTFTGELAGDVEAIVANIKAESLKLFILGEGYNRFIVKMQGDKFKLSFLDNIPEILQKEELSFKSEMRLHISPLNARGVVHAQGLYSTIDANFDIDKHSALYQASIDPKQESELFKEYKIGNFTPFEFTFYDAQETDIFNFDAKLLNITLFKKDDSLSGWGNLSSSSFDVSGNIVNQSANVFASIPSVHDVLLDFEFVSKEDELFFDAKMDINATLVYKDKMQIKSRIELPWYLLELDSQTSYIGENNFVESTLDDNEIRISSYNFEVMNYKIHSQKPSRLFISPDLNVELKEFWIYDNLLLSGLLESSKMQGDIKIKSEKFSYEGEEGNLTAKADLRASFDAKGKQKIEGSITILDGVVSYLPKKDYIISDEDIIIIQDIKDKRNVNRFINIHVNSIKPISYKIKDVDISFSPDITVFEEPGTSLQVLGMVSIDKGEVSGGGKTFEFDKSEIYFYGAKPINPHLNLNLHYYTINYIDIEIFITNTLNAPVIILSSKPAMSQNDIMSYILFGDTASSVFDSSGESTTRTSLSNLLLGTGLKQIFNETTGVKVDTLNILTNKEGTLGYEVGARFNKQIRVVYKNDTVSSVILQYSLSKSIRIDVDSHETGQGINIIYVKDFKDFK